ncbi:FtsK/SpoIIIE family DNA translocase [Aureivirga sp. CE67]|uniref:FtsK/SpoIIIE family DNA translocase n=1 Tax=Aureivirga sp. CE67 TaxID=1788983 RepID=UPI0018CB5976|nr:DNA translocase FtsK [Aureivirga sp. CE67]
MKKIGISIKKLENLNKPFQNQAVVGLFLVLFSFFLTISFISYFSNWGEDQSVIGSLTDRSIEVKNMMGKIGAYISYIFIYKGFGIASFVFSTLLFLSGLYRMVQADHKKLRKNWRWAMLGMVWLSLTVSFFFPKSTIASGIIGFEIKDFLQHFLGKIGVFLLILFTLLSYLAIRFKITTEHIKRFFLAIFNVSKKHIEKRKEEIEVIKKQKAKEAELKAKVQATDKEKLKKEQKPQTVQKTTIKKEVQKPEPKVTFELNQETKPEEQISTNKVENVKPKEESKSNFTNSFDNLSPTIQNYSTNEASAQEDDSPKLEIEVAVEKEEKTVEENLADRLVNDFGEFDPTLELGNFSFPSIDLLKKYDESISIDQEELEANNNRIIETLKHYKIGIEHIKATVGPTVTLYEIIPEAGVRISKIKNLEDDIALSLSALGIRIIAPIPGKGTIGIEVPNKKPSIVSMRSVIASTKFQTSEMELPIALGKSISNETFVADLAKMPHLLMAGATGQGKSVGLNAILTSLLYKKHPAEVKFVLVDPKKVELTLFNKIERHYLAKLPDTEEAIITDTTKVIDTLNSLCIEMDARYDMLKNAMTRNIKEYNAKFKARKLNPENGHKFLPYIVLVIDEFADLIMTAGKEVETPIARLAQLARAVGIHLIVATQRPSVNVITGIIKANFPARIAFRVTSKIDSRTILDSPGADQLIGRGDMLYSGGNDLTRLQCAFVDTPEVERITDFIGMQRAYPDAHLLPEYSSEENGTSLDIDIEDRDKLFKEAAILIVHAQQGSASLLQRKLKLGYNRAGRLIDQLEAAGIVGPFEGSKARQVLVPDEMALNQLLENEKN